MVKKVLYIIYKVIKEIPGNVIENTNSVRNKLVKKRLDKTAFNILVIKPEVLNAPFFSFSFYILNPV